MPVSPNSLKNLNPMKKGDPPVPGCGKPKGYKSFKVMIREIMESDPEEYYLAHEDDVNLQRLLKEKKITSIKKLMLYRLAWLAVNNFDKEAAKILIKESGESEADNVNINVSGDIDKTIASLSPEKLIELHNIIDSVDKNS